MLLFFSHQRKSCECRRTQPQCDVNVLRCLLRVLRWILCTRACSELRVSVLGQPQCGPHQSHGHVAEPRCARCLVPHRSSQFWKCFCLMVQGQHLYPRRGTTGSSSRSVPSPADTIGDTDFVVWVLRAAPECRNLHLHTPVVPTPLLLPSSC